MIKNAREVNSVKLLPKNPRHIHTSIRPHEGYRGLAFCYRGVCCCSFFEGDYKLPNGEFDRDGAERAALQLNTIALKKRAALRDEASYFERKAMESRVRALNPF